MTFAFFFAADGEDFFMISTGLTEAEVGTQALGLLTKNRNTRSLKATETGYEMIDTKDPTLPTTWRWVPDSEVK